MTRRDPALEAAQTAYLPSITGSGVLVAPQSGIVIAPTLLQVASLGAAGTAEFSWDGTPFKTLAVPANGSANCPLVGLEGPIGSGLNVFTTTAMSVTALYTTVDETTPITKEQARADTYAAYVAAKSAGRQAIRTPNRSGGQVEG